MSKTVDIFSGIRANRKRQESFTDYCEKEYSKTSLSFESRKENYLEQILHGQTFLEGFRQEMSEVPLSTAIAFWLKHDGASHGHDDADEVLTLLVSRGVIKLENEAGNVFTLEDLSFNGHQSTIESIRCLLDYSLEERERMVGVYLRFSRHLAQVTMGYVPSEDDPDRAMVAKKAISYTQFLDFSRRLPNRDSMIATLMFYSEPSMSDVIDLKVGHVNFDRNTISFGALEAEYPKHILLKLKQFTDGKSANDLVFVNRKGEAVNRTRLYKSFKNASAKMEPAADISPTDLQKKNTM